MKVRILVSLAGLPMPHYGITSDFALQPGDVLELHDELAEKWVGSGKAEPVVVERAPLKHKSSRKSEEKD